MDMDNERPKANIRDRLARLKQRDVAILGKGKAKPEKVIDLGQITPEPEPEIIIEEIPEVKIEGAGVTLEEAQQEARYESMLEKPNDFGAAVNALPIDGQTKERLKHFRSGRSHYHLLRLLQAGRSEAERDFGLAYLQFSESTYDELLSQNKQLAQRMLGVINSEGYDTMMWWTMAPYLFTHLAQRGIEKRNALGRIIRWAKDGAVREDDREMTSRINLHGLEAINEVGYGQNSYVLSHNPIGPSHVLTQHLAGQIVDAYLTH